MTQENSGYDGSVIKVFKGLSAIRHRPGMYIGDTDKKGLHHLIWEILDNSIDEAMAGHAKNIYITIFKDEETISIEDDGRGIPVDMHPTEGKSALEVAMTVLHAGGKMTSDSSGYVASGGLHGVGASCVNALSDLMKVEVHRDGYLWRQEYSRGDPTTKVDKIRKLEKGEKPTGTKTTWHADIQIFKRGVKLDEKEIIRRLRETAFLNKSLRLVFVNEATSTKEEFKFDGGIGDYVLYLVQNKNGIYPDAPIYGQKSLDGMQVEVALSWTDEDDSLLFSYANNINTIDGGTHLSGFKTSITRTINKLAFANEIFKEKDTGLEGRDIQEGLTAIISIRLPQPEFVGQTKAKLGTVEAESVVSSVTAELLTDYFERNPKILSKVIDRALLAQRARKAAKDAAAAMKKKSFLGGGRIPGKLRDCRSSDNAVTELFIVEGDSAAGSASGGRDSEVQAILSNKGKIINAEKNDLSDLMKNEEVINLMICIGTGVKDSFDITKLKYGKIIIMCLAGGTRIRTLDGRHPTIKQLSEENKKVWIWTRSGEKIIPVLSDPPVLTRKEKRKVVLELDSGEKITTTIDHKFMVNYPDPKDKRVIWKSSGENGYPLPYIKAQDLKPSDSLCHVVFKETELGSYPQKYETIKFNNSLFGLKTQFVHRYVWQHFASDEDKSKYATGKYDIHHDDNNEFNNTPENLKLLTDFEHTAIHFDSVKQSLLLKQLHENGHYDGTSHFIQYNQTETHSENIKNHHAKGLYNCSKGFKNYNGTEKQLNDLRRNWSQGSYSTKEYKDKLSDTAKARFESPAEKQKISKSIKEAWSIPEKRMAIIRGRGFSIVDKVLLSENINIDNINEKLYNNYRKHNDPLYKTFLNNFDNEEHFRREYMNSRGLNHRVKSVTIAESEEEDFYCFNIPNYGNFVLENGLISSNSDADDDGYHIRTLLMTFFYRFMRPLVEHGHVYIAQAPLYMIEKKGDPIYCWSDNELQDNLAKLPTKPDVKRFKGLGEMDAEQLAETTMRKGKRHLLQVTMEDAAEAERILTILMGKNVPLRKQHINNNVNNSLVSVGE